MKYRRFGATDLTVSELSLGSSALGGGIFYRDDKEALRVLRMAYDAGITFYDTAENYGMGRHEELIGQAFKTFREKVVITSKGGLLMTQFGRLVMHLRPMLIPVRSLLQHRRRALGKFRDSQKKYSFAPSHMRRSLEGSLCRLKTDYIDVYQFFNVTESTLERDDLFDVMDRFKEEGKIRYAGVTVLKANPAFASLQQERMDSIQVPVSLIDPMVVHRFLPLARARNLAVIGRSPLGQGFLTDATGHVKAIESRHLTDQDLADRKTAADRMRFLVTDGRTLAQAALQYALQLDGVSVVLFSVANYEQLSEDLGALESTPLTARELARIDKTLHEPDMQTLTGSPV